MSIPVTTAQLSAQLADFCNFAIAHASQGDSSSVAQLATSWEAEREYAETVEEVRQSEREFADGKGIPHSQAMIEIRQMVRDQQQLEG